MSGWPDNLPYLNCANPGNIGQVLVAFLPNSGPCSGASNAWWIEQFTCSWD
jgi:hypothetical protein